MRLRLAVCAVWIGAAGASHADATDCAQLTRALKSFGGYTLTAPSAAPEDGWCVLDGASFRAAAEDAPNLTIERLRLQGSTVDGVPASVTVEVAGLRILPKAGSRALDNRLRSLVRLQTADIRLTAMMDPDGDRFLLEGGEIILSGGTELRFSAEVKDAGLSVDSLLRGSLTSLQLEWRNDGRLLRPVMDVIGERLSEDGKAGSAVDITRAALGGLVDNLPAASLSDEARAALEKLIPALPQGRGVVEVAFTSEDGIGASRLAVAVLTKDPLGPVTLARLLADSRIEVRWTPGLAN